MLAAPLVAPASVAAGTSPETALDRRLQSLCAAAMAADAAAVAREDAAEEADGRCGEVSIADRGCLDGEKGPYGEVEAWRARLRMVSHLPALTPAGLRAKASLLLALQPHPATTNPVATPTHLDALIDEGAAEEALLLSLLADILRPGPASPLRGD